MIMLKRLFVLVNDQNIELQVKIVKFLHELD